MTNCYGETRYEYDIFSNLKKVTLPTGQVIEYKVDGLNRRVKKVVDGTVKEYYLWYDQTRIAAVLDANKQTKLVYLYGPESTHSPSYVIKEGVSYRILHDPGLGSIRYVINPSTREIVQEIEYDEYGNMMKNTNANFQPLTYAGGLYDGDTKLIRFGARDYDPTVGRWTTKDPIGFAGGDTNLYGYVGQNPMSRIDPNGLFPKNLDEAGECLWSNHENVLNGVLRNSVNVNQRRISEINRQLDSQDRTCLDSDKISSLKAEKRVLEQSNAGYLKQIQSMIEKCSYFPTID